mmetsp:Transcript_26704/g.41893  ORF Transcript_26704/g.41893 Transcript_26704/m.41893 type:complete len:465 (-) Transcript_26704:142-1536(-)
MMYRTTFIAAAPALLAITTYYTIAPPFFCSGMCCFVKSTCADVPMEKNLVQPKFEKVAAALAESLAIGWDLGASVFMRVNGETVLDIAGGYQDKERTVPYNVNTMNMVFSSGKIPETIGVALLVDKGLMELDTPLIKYWPEFAQKGKGEITMGDILGHRSGAMDTFEETPDAATLQDDRKRDEFLASQSFLFPRGTVGYRGASSALYTDAVVRRVDPLKRSLFQLVQEEIFDPLGQSIFCPPISSRDWDGRMSKVHDIPVSKSLLGVIPQLYLPSFYRRVLGEDHPIVLDDSEVNLYRHYILKDDPKSPFALPGIPDMDQGEASWNNRSSWFSYPMMSANCVTNARGTGNALDAFMRGEIVSEDTLTLFLKPVATNEFDNLLYENVTYLAGGFGNSGDGKDAGIFKQSADCTGWGGFGGSTIMHCLIGAYNVTLSYVPNGLSPRVKLDRGMKLLNEVAGILLEE